MTKKRVVVALGHRALGTTLPEQKNATKRTAKIIADLVEAGAEVIDPSASAGYLPQGAYDGYHYYAQFCAGAHG